MIRREAGTGSAKLARHRATVHGNLDAHLDPASRIRARRTFGLERVHHRQCTGGPSAATAIGFAVFAPAAGIRFLALLRKRSRYGERLAIHHATLVQSLTSTELMRGILVPAGPSG